MFPLPSARPPNLCSRMLPFQAPRNKIRTRKVSTLQTRKNHDFATDPSLGFCLGTFSYAFGLGRLFCLLPRCECPHAGILSPSRLSGSESVSESDDDDSSLDSSTPLGLWYMQQTGASQNNDHTCNKSRHLTFGALPAQTLVVYHVFCPLHRSPRLIVPP
jgi:hypothetical protein